MPLDGDPKPYSKETQTARTPKQLARLRFDFDDARRRYLAGETTVELAKEYGVSPTAVGLALKRLGLRLTPHWKRAHPNIPPGFKAITDARREATHCKRGHPYDDRNTYVNLRGVRECRRCTADKQNERRREERRRGITREKWGLSLKPEPRCRNCLAPAEHLHHAVPRGKALHVRADLRNGLPLCEPCHRGWHQKKVTIYRDVFSAEEWSFVSSIELTGERIEAWLDRHYPRREESRAPS